MGSNSQVIEQQTRADCINRGKPVGNSVRKGLIACGSSRKGQNGCMEPEISSRFWMTCVCVSKHCVCSIGWLANICQIFKVLVFFSAPVFTCSLKMCLTQNHKNRKSASPQHGTNFLNWTNFIQSIWVNKLNPDKRALNQIKMTSTIEQQHQKWLTCLFSFLFVSINHASPHEKSNPFFPRCKLNSNQDLKISKWVRWLKKIDLPCIENCQTYQLSSEAFVVRNWHVKCMQREKK